MTSIDIATLVNLIASGFIGFCFGAISTWLKYRYDRKRDDIAWEREKKKQLREELTRGLDNPKEVLRGLKILTEQLRERSKGFYQKYPADLLALPLLQKVRIMLEEQESENVN